MSTQVPPTKPREAAATDPSIGRLVNDALEDMSALIRDEIALAKSEIKVDVKRGGIGAAMFIVAAVFAFLGLIFALHTMAQVIAVFLPVWAGYLIVTLLLFLGAVVVALIGKKQLSKVKGVPERTVATTQETVESLRRASTGEISAAAQRTDAPLRGTGTAR